MTSYDFWSLKIKLHHQQGRLFSHHLFVLLSVLRELEDVDQVQEGPKFMIKKEWIVSLDIRLVGHSMKAGKAVAMCYDRTRG